MPGSPFTVLQHLRPMRHLYRPVKDIGFRWVWLVAAIALTACGNGGSPPSASNPPAATESSPPAANNPSNPDAADSDATDDGIPEESPTADAEASTTAPNSVNIGQFTTDELFDAGGGGCGMSLKPVGTPWQEGGIFFHGIEDAPAFMVIDDTMTQLTRTEAKGEDFYGQRTEQTFVNDERSLVVTVAVTLGEPGEIESINIPEGLMIVNQAGTTTEIAVDGDAGC